MTHSEKSPSGIAYPDDLALLKRAMIGSAKNEDSAQALLKRSSWPRELWTYLVWAFSTKMLFTRAWHSQLIIFWAQRGDSREHGRK